MPLPRRRKPQETPLDRKARALREQEEKVRRQKQECEQLLRDAPKIREEEEKRLREALVVRSRRGTRRNIDTPAIVDKRDYQLRANVGTRSLRRERRQQQKQFLGVFLIFLIVMFLLYLKLRG